MNKEQILARLEQIKTEEKALKAMLRVMDGKSSQPKAKREAAPTKRQSSFLRMADAMINSKRAE